jgi:hypothetical protein
MKNEENAYIEMQMHGTKIRVTFDHHDLSIDEIEAALRGLLIGLTWHPDTVNELFGANEED